MERTRLPAWVNVVAPDDVNAIVSLLPTDVSHYKAVHHIGDIQGSYNPLVAYFETYPLNDNELYIFVGDYLDRGPQNAAVM